MTTHNPYIDYFVNQALGDTPQIGRGFYKGLPWQKGYGVGGLLGSIARRFVPLLKPLIKAAGKKLLHTGTSIVSDLIDGKPVKFKDTGKNLIRAGTTFVSDIIDGKPDHTRLNKNDLKKNGRHRNVTKIRNKKRKRVSSNVIPNKRQRRTDIFS